MNTGDKTKRINDILKDQVGNSYCRDWTMDFNDL